MDTILAAFAKLIQDNGMAGFIAVGAACLIYYVLRQEDKREQRDAEREKSLMLLLREQKDALNAHTSQQKEMFADQKVANVHNREEHKNLMAMGEGILAQCNSA